MRGQTKFPAGFGCDPTLASSGALSRGLLKDSSPRARPVPVMTAPPVVPSPAFAPVPLPSTRRRAALRLQDIETQAHARRERSVSAFWPSAALGLVLATSLYFLNYF